MRRNLQSLSLAALLLYCAGAHAARVESEDAQNYGASANPARAVVSAQAQTEGHCDFGEPATRGYSAREAFGRAVCNRA